MNALPYLIIGAVYGICVVLLDTARMRSVDFGMPWVLGGALLVQWAIEWRLHESEGRLRRLPVALGRTLATAGAAVSVGFVLYSVLRPLEANELAVPVLPTFVSWTLAVFGIESSVAGGALLLEGMAGTIELAMGLDKLALGPLAMMGAIAALRAGPTLDRRKIAAGLLCVASAILVRQVLCAVLLAQDAGLFRASSGAALAGIYGSRWIDAGTIGLVLLLHTAVSRVWRALPQGSWIAPLTRGRGALRWAAIAAVLLTSSWAAFHFEAAGARRAGVVLFDDYHNDNWGRSDRRMDERWYGDYSTYNMNAALEWLGHYFPASVNRGRKIDRELLEGASVLVLKTPSKPYEPEEVEAIHEWVEHGGSLLAIGDHTDLHGMNTHLNVVLRPYGVTLNFDAVSDAHSGSFNEYVTRPWVPEPGILASLDRVEFMTGCSISTAGWPGRAMVGERAARDRGDYTRGSNFGARRSDPSTGVGPALLALGRTTGAGKVAVLTDQTIFSSYSLYKSGHDDLLLSVMGWLSRAPSAGLARLLLVLGCLGLVLGAGLAWASAPIFSLVLAAPLILASNVGIHELHRRAFAPPAPDAELRSVDVLWIGGVCAFPPSIGSIGKLETRHAYDTLLTDIARTGLQPRIVREYEDAPGSESDVVLLINPVWEPPAEFLERLGSWVREGGTLVILDPEESTWKDTSSDTFLSSMGALPEAFQGASRERWTRRPASDGFASGASDLEWVRYPHGSGIVFHSFGSEKFSRKGIAHAFTLPGEKVRERLHDLYTILKDATARVPVDRRTYALILDKDSIPKK